MHAYNYSLGWIQLVANDAKHTIESMLRARTCTSSSLIYGQSSNYLGSLNTHKLYGYEQVINDRYSVGTFDKSAKVLWVNEFCWLAIACMSSHCDHP